MSAPKTAVAGRYSANVNAIALESELRRQVRGEVRFDTASRALYATDGSNYRQVPIGVVLPRDTQDVIAAVAVCRKFGAPLLPRGCGTSLAGQCCNVAVVVDFTRHMNQILELDPVRKIARIQPGVVLDNLRNAAEKYHLTFGPDPATHNRCTLGGMIGNNSCGVHSIMAGMTSDNVHELDLLLYDGTRMKVGATSGEELERIIRDGGRRGKIYAALRDLRDRYAGLVRARYPDIPRRVSGYNLPALLSDRGFHVARALTGTEGTCAIVLEATVRLVDSPQFRRLLVLGYRDAYECADHVPEIMDAGPIGVEGFDDCLVQGMKKKGLHAGSEKLLPPGGGWLLVEFGGNNQQEADAKAHGLLERLGKATDPPAMRMYDDKKHERKVWDIRESALGATAVVPGEAEKWEGWEDSAVPIARLGQYLRQLRALFQKYGYAGAMYGHYGQGCIHTRIDFDLESADGIRNFRAFMEEAADLVVSHGGSLSGEHGDGQARAELLVKMFGPELVEAFREFKRIWDPDWKMNPGKVVDPYRLDENLRLGADYDPWHPETRFQFPDDNGSFAHAALRCVGVGKCRREAGDTMCPSFRVTREEMHSTRGRAHLLWEMLQGEVVRDGWRSEEVKESLDLCLSCKGCKTDCPVNVDIASYKSEFLSHYYEGRFRPRSAYAMGLVDIWAAAASRVPGLANLITQMPATSAIARFIAGMPEQRRIPAFAPQTFKQWFKRRPPRNQGCPQVMLWPDTFNNHFTTEVCQAAAGVLEAAGFQVIVPRQNLCCGRPLYDFGMLDRAQRLLREIMDVLEPELEAGTPIIVLEPSCAAVFRDELKNFFPHDPRAKQLAQQTFLLSEFLQTEAAGFSLPKLTREAIAHGHCHQKSVLKMDSEEAVLRRLGLDVEMLDSGCCGMAGSFGFEREKYDVSMAVGELVLLPRVRSAAPDTLVIADGFSCREQIAQGAGRRALHLAEVIHMAMAGGAESTAAVERESRQRQQMLRTGMTLGGLALAGAALWGAWKSR